MNSQEHPFDDARTASDAPAPQREHPRQASEVSPKNDATPTAIGASDKAETSMKEYAAETRRTSRMVRVRETSRQAFARTVPTRAKARTEVLRMFAAAGPAGLTDPELFRLLPAWGESTLRPARNKLVADGVLVATAARRYSPSGCACIVWRIVENGSVATRTSGAEVGGAL